MRYSAVTTWLLDEIEAVLTNTSLVSLASPGQHTDVVEGRDPPVYPFVGVQPIATPQESAGLGAGQAFVDETTYTNGTIDSITYRWDQTARVSLVPVTDGDAALRDDLGEELGTHFSLLARQDAFTNDIETISVGEGAPQGRPDQYVRGVGVPVSIEYSYYETDDSITAAEEVNVDITSEDADSGDEDSGVTLDIDA